MTLWTSEAAAAATGGRVRGAWHADGVSIDTRTLAPGDLFVALAAARDGHDFVAQALDKGAAAAMVSHIPPGVAPDAPLLVVPDVLEALVALGCAARARTQARVIAVTGSVGKTSTKEMLRAALTGQGRVHAAEASYNNHWGVPLTLARMPRDTAHAIIEIGMNHPGEIAPLSRMAAPHVALITTVGAAHLEAFDSIEGIAREKAAIFEGLVPGGTAVVNGDLPVTPILTAAAEAAGARIVRFGEDEANEFRATTLAAAAGTTVVQALHPGGELLFKVASPGRHMALNALGALAAALAAGADPALTAQALGRWQPPAGRGSRERLVLDAVHDHLAIELIDDAFNANPASMAAAFDLLIAAEPGQGGRRVAILGDMLELGSQEGVLHRALADHPGLSAIDTIHTLGPRMAHLHAALPEAQRGLHVTEAAQLSSIVHTLLQPGDIVLVKGSKGIKAAAVVDAIRKLGHRERSTGEGAV